MIANKIRGKVVLVSSLVGFFSFAGYSAYSPAKYALRGKTYVPNRLGSIGRELVTHYRAGRCIAQRVPLVWNLCALLFSWNNL